MKQILKIAALAFILTAPNIATPSMAQEPDCEGNAELSQAGLNTCAWREYQTADKQLNANWKLIKQYAAQIDSENSDYVEQTTAGKDLLKGQRAWIKYRDGHCDMVAAQYAGGSILPLILSTCLTDLTKERSFQFTQILKGQ